MNPAPAQHSGAARLAGLGLMALLGGCVPAHRHPSWAIYPLPRHGPHDGLAVVSQPDGYGLHLWIDTDTSSPGRCRPRWNVDPARLFNGNGSAPFSSGLAPRREFFEAVGRADVRRALRQQSEALCRERASSRRFDWREPPRSEAEVKAEAYPLLEEPDLLSDPNAVLEQEQLLLEKGDGSNPAKP